jgi:hypothetical protein
MVKSRREGCIGWLSLNRYDIRSSLQRTSVGGDGGVLMLTGSGYAIRSPEL